jgi:glycosyltransferase involved in cell wall biosynthesis
VRYAYDLYLQYLEESNLTYGIKSWLARHTLYKLRQWDYISAQRVDKILANSAYIAKRIRKAWNREAEVVFPPVATDKFKLKTLKDDYYFTAARLVPYKKVDMIVEAFAEMPDKKLIVAGDGPMMKQVKAALRPNITLMPHVPFDQLISLMQEAKAFVFAAEEDFGITLVEAQATGTPVIAFGKGGATETVVPNKTGILFEEQTKESIKAAVLHFESHSNWFDAAYIAEHASQFSEERFRNHLSEIVTATYNDFQNGIYIR